MIDDFNKKAYESIKAPVELKARVMNMYDEASNQRKNTVNYKKYLSLAACLVLVIGVSAFFSVSRVSVSVGDTGTMQGVASYNGSMLISERSNIKSQDFVEVELKSCLKSKVAVSQGFITLFDAETGEKLSQGEELSFKGSVIAQWNLTKVTTESEMNVENSIFKKTLKAQYDAENDSFSVK